MKKSNFFALLFLVVSYFTNAQAVNALCNDYSIWTSTTHSCTSVTNKADVLDDTWSNKSQLIDGSTSNAACWSAVLLGSSRIKVRSSFYCRFCSKKS